MVYHGLDGAIVLRFFFIFFPLSVKVSNETNFRFYMEHVNRLLLFSVSGGVRGRFIVHINSTHSEGSYTSGAVLKSNAVLIVTRLLLKLQFVLGLPFTKGRAARRAILTYITERRKHNGNMEITNWQKKTIMNERQMSCVRVCVNINSLNVFTVLINSNRLMCVIISNASKNLNCEMWGKKSIRRAQKNGNENLNQTAAMNTYLPFPSSLLLSGAE